MYRRLLTLMLLGIGPALATADPALQLQEGQWEISSQTDALGTSGSAPLTTQACYSKEDIANRKAAIPGDEQCEVADYQTAGRVATWQINCRGPGEIVGNGSLSFDSATAYHGEIELRVSMPGQAEQRLTTRYRARRLGDCPR